MVSDLDNLEQDFGGECEGIFDRLSQSSRESLSDLSAQLSGG
jgi:hypothetical protein